MNEYVRLEEVTKIIEEQIRKRYCLEMGNTDRTVLNVLQVVKTRIWKLDIVEAEPVRHGHWVKCQGKSNIWYCSECGEKINYKQNRRTYNIPEVPVWQKNKRCRNCGAKMGGAEDACNKQDAEAAG